jgi:chemotaxis protein methyltransferase CheR
MQLADRSGPSPAVRLIRDLIHERSGVYFEDDRLDLMSEKLSSLMIERGFDSHLDYYYLLKYDADSAVEWNRLLDAISVRETFFWRETDQMRALADFIIPQHFALSSEPFTIWSSACASGEEPLTIAMFLHQAGWLDRAPIVIRASDASEAALSIARRGLYRERSFRTIPPHVRDVYFERVENGWQVSPDLHRRICWQHVNLADRERVSAMARTNAIFCRNVFIYFSDAAIRRTVRLFAENMLPPGLLFVGAAESLLRISADFALTEIGKAFVYMRA